MNFKAILLATTGVVFLACEASADNVSFGSTRSNTKNIAAPKDTDVKKDAKKGAISYGSTRSNTRNTIAAPKNTDTGLKKKKIKK